MNNNYNMQKSNRGKNSPNNVKTDFYNPYTFVSVNDRVFYLNEEEVKELATIQDVPVEHSLSGSIEVVFKALSPFCVRSDGEQSANMNGKYFVPGSSIKGMIRSVFEIMTYSNMRNGIANSRYSMRDLSNDDYKLKSSDGPQRSGFLVLLNGNYYIQECKSEAKKYSEIAQLANKRPGIDEKQLKFAKKIRDKYDLLRSPFVKVGEEMKMWFFSNFIDKKNHEFLFDIPDFDESHLIPLEEKEYNDFIFIHEKENANESWKYWKRKLKNYSSIEEIKKDNYYGIVPCFFRKKTNKFAVRDLGFSLLYRQPYPYTIHDFLPDEHKKDGIDLAQAVFGYVNSNNALKGRVQVGNAFIENAKPTSEQTFVMGSPKPTFFPFYIEQEDGKKQVTYCSKNSIINGYKRFLLWDSAKIGDAEKTKVTSSFIPLSQGTQFTTRIYFHNLHDYELGALLSAITFYQNMDCSHALGYAKPFGYGRLAVTDCKLNLANDSKIVTTDLYKAFVTKIYERLGLSEDDWLDDMAYLFYIAQGNYEPQKEIRYPKMKNTKEGQKSNEFIAIKNQKLSLVDFTPE